MKMDLAALESSLGNEYILGKVHYKTVNNIKRLLFKYRDDAKPSKEKLLRLFFFKRKAFKNDMEVRLITADSLITGDVKSIDVDAKGMIREVMFDPRIDDGLYASYRSFLKSKAYDFKGKVHKSKLYSPTKVFEII
jgi:hypothetical protein